MYKPFINPLIPRPIAVETETIRGELSIEGNLEHNYIRFRFCFTELKETAPVSVSVEAENKVFIYNCIINSYLKSEVKTAVFHPEFNICRQFNVIGIEPLVKYKKIL
ncbi:MAG: hypothetical protein FWD26_03520 [Treponema sp.]|nr:hypothetical protein [Treponema sp.]